MAAPYFEPRYSSKILASGEDSPSTTLNVVGVALSSNTNLISLLILNLRCGGEVWGFALPLYKRQTFFSKLACGGCTSLQHKPYLSLWLKSNRWGNRTVHLGDGINGLTGLDALDGNGLYPTLHWIRYVRDIGSLWRHASSEAGMHGDLRGL